MFVYYKCYILIRLTFLKELMLIKQVHQKSVISVTIAIFLNHSFKFQPNVCNRCYDLFMMSMNLSDMLLKNKGSDYHCIINLIRKHEKTISKKFNKPNAKC